MKRNLLTVLIVFFALTLLVVIGLVICEKAVPPTPEAATALPTESAEPTSEPTPEPTPEPIVLPEGDPQFAARQLTLTTDARGMAPTNLFDDNYYTDYTFAAGATVTFTAEEKIDSLYIVFGTYPGEWTLQSDGGEQLCGQEGFLHEYVKLETPSKEIRICLGDERVMVRDVYAFTEGYLPDFVQTWQRIEDGADILVFSTHTDDELIFLGGLIPYYSAVRGLRVQVAYMTSNYLTSFSNYRFRPHEALNGLWVCGDHFYPDTNEVHDYECEHYWDAVRFYGEEQFVEFQVELIRRYKPLVVVTQAEDGEYGHGAHILTALSVEKAVEAAADPEQFPESAARYGVWDTPKTYLHYYGDPEDYTWLNYETRAAALGWKTPFEVAQEAYLKHASQQQWGFRIYGFGHPYDCHRLGLYRSLVGPDEAHDDLMEHVSRELFPYE